MAFIDEVRTRSRRFKERLDYLDTEEATKNALVMPFLQMLGYNIFDPTEVVPEFTADFGTKRGEKVDYALMQNGKPVILIEAKRYGTPLRVGQESQLFRYFSAATSARFAILTDGIIYRFYSDLEETGGMDRSPFYEFNMLEFTPREVEQLSRFRKDKFDPEQTIEAARELKITNQLKRALEGEMRNPSDEFVRFMLGRIEYPHPKTGRRIEQFTPVVQEAFRQFVNDLLESRLKSAIESGKEPASQDFQVEGIEPGGSAGVEYPLFLFLKSKAIEGRARRDGKGQFVVLAGSQAVKEEKASIPRAISKMRRTLVESGVLVDEGAVYRLASDQTFKTSSGGASFLKASSASGLADWRDGDGQRLRDILATPG